MDLKLKKKISKMSLEELNKFLDTECETQEDRENLLSELVNNPYLELYEDNKDLTNIILEDGKKISLDFNDLKIDDDFVFECNFKVITKDKRVYQTNICCTTKEIIYYRINEYLKEYLTYEDVIKYKSKNENIKKELQKLSRLKKELLSYINKQKTIYREFTQDIENLITGAYSIGINDYQNKLYKSMLQDVRDTKKALIKKAKIDGRISTLKYYLFEDLKYFLQENYDYQKTKIKIEIKTLEAEIKNYDKFKDGLLQKKDKLKKLQDKLKAIPKDGATKMEHFLNSDSLNLKIDSRNKAKYNKNYIFLYKTTEY